MRYNTSFVLMALFSTLLGGCIQYSDTLNRPQVSTLPADGGDLMLFNQNNAMPNVNTNAPQATAAAVAQKGGVHPNIVYFYEKLCADTQPGDPPCSLNDATVAYQDEDVALVTTNGLPAYEGSGGYDLILLDLKGSPGSVLFHEATAAGEKLVRKGQRVTITYAGYSGNKRKVIDLTKKPRAKNMCEFYPCF